MTIATVQHCPPDLSTGEVVARLKLHNIGAMIITKESKVVGIFTERDLLQRVFPQMERQGVSVLEEPIEVFMTNNPVSVSPDTPLKKIMAALRLGKFRHLTVINSQGSLMGVISIKDVLNRITDYQTEMEKTA